MQFLPPSRWRETSYKHDMGGIAHVFIRFATTEHVVSGEAF